MIRIVNGNLLDANENIIAHQANCRGSMGAGVATQIREKWPDICADYVTFCSAHHRSGRELLGEMWVSQTFNEYGMPIEVCHLFGQDGYGGGGCNTDYISLRKALLRLKNYAMRSHSSIAMPYKIGCGLGGGDWEKTVYPMLEDIFGGEDVELVLYRKEVI